MAIRLQALAALVLVHLETALFLEIAHGVKGKEEVVVDYLANTTLAACDLARDAAFLCTTPDLVALSIADA